MSNEIVCVARIVRNRTRNHSPVFLLFPQIYLMYMYRHRPFPQLLLLLRATRSRGCLLISPGGLLSLHTLTESLRRVSRIARRFSNHPILPCICSFFLLRPPPVFCVGRLAAAARKGEKRTRMDERRGVFVFQERSFEYEYALIDW